VRYFGEPWASGICDEGRRVPTPVGSKCVHCFEAFQEGDRGVSFDSGMLMHRECMLRSMVGGVECLKRERAGTHRVGDHDPDPPGLTRRDAALATWAWVTEHGG
jgi:hypothetical protein